MSIIGVGSRWERKALEIIAKEEAPTLVRGQVLGRAESKWPRFDVYEFMPDREEFKDNPIILSGQEWSISLQLSMLQAFYQLLSGLKLDTENLGYFLGYPYEQWLYHNPIPLSIQIHWNIVKTYEYGAVAKELKSNQKLKGLKTFNDRHITIPNVSRSNVTWENIKSLVGNGYRYGSHYACVSLGEKQSEKLAKFRATKLFADSKANALKEIKNLLKLSNSKNLTITAGEELKEGVRATDLNMQKPEVWLYPRDFTIINYHLVNEALSRGGKGRGTSAGRKLRNLARIPLWVDQKPEDADRLIDDALAYAP